jgi:hypothetical protein
MQKPLYGGHGAEVLRVLDQYGGATGHEVNVLTGLRSPEAHLHRLGQHGLVYVTSRTRRNGSGRKGRVWDLTKTGFLAVRLSNQNNGNGHHVTTTAASYDVPLFDEASAS